MKKRGLPKKNNGLLVFPTKLMAIVAHPDDEVAGAGGTLAKNVELGGKSHVICFGGDDKIRAKEFEASCRVLGVTYELLGRKEGKFGDDERGTRMMLRKKIIDFQPEFIITHKGYDDYHPDHLIVSEIARNAAIWAQTPKEGWIVKGLLYTEGHFMHPMLHIIVDVSEQLDKLFKAFACHKSQIKKNDSYYIDSLKSRTRRRGVQAGCEYGEGFIFEPLPLVSGFNRKDLSI